MDREPAVARGSRLEQRTDVPVQLDRLEPAGPLQQRYRERAASGTDLDQPVPRPGSDRRHDPGDDARIVQEVLAEALARPMSHRSAAPTMRAAQMTAS